MVNSSYDEGKSRKIYYIYRRLDVNDKKRVDFLLDYQGVGNFDSCVHKFLLDPNTTDRMVLSVVPGCGSNKKLLNNFILKYIDIFKEINNIFITNHSCPPFPHPEDVAESETIRFELAKLYQVDELNKYFGVSSFYDYMPPIYKEGNL